MKKCSCAICNKTNNLHKSADNEIICNECLNKFFAYCPNCGKYHVNFDIIEWNGVEYCIKCAVQIANAPLARCECCVKGYKTSDLIVIDDMLLCKNCIDNKKNI